MITEQKRTPLITEARIKELHLQKANESQLCPRCGRFHSSKSFQAKTETKKDSSTGLHYWKEYHICPSCSCGYYIDNNC